MSSQGTQSSRTPLLASILVIVLIGAAFGFYFVTSSSNDSSLHGQISSLSSEASAQALSVSSLGAVVKAQSSSISSLMSLAESQSSSITSLRAGLANLTQSRVIAGNVTVEPSSTNIYGSNFTSFSAPFEGYLVIAGTSREGDCGGSACGIAVVYDPTSISLPSGVAYNPVSIHSYNTTSFALYSPILPSTDVVVAWQSLVFYSGAVSSDNATITVTYYY